MQRHMVWFPLVALSCCCAGSLGAQAILRAAPSGRATSEVSLSFPRPAAAPAMTGMTGMAGMAGMPAPPAPATAPAAPAPLVIRVDYGQPHLRGRVLHGDSLVPYGKAWRTGAGGSTLLSTDVDLMLGGKPLARGTYVLYSIPDRAEWMLVVQRNVKQSPMQYADSNDVARIPLRHVTLASPFESFTMWLIPDAGSGPARGELRFAWGTDQLSAEWALR